MSEAAALKEEGNAKFKANQFAAAVDAYTRSLEQDPTQHLCLSNRSAAYLKLGGAAEQALSDAERCVELAPQFAKGYSRQAAALQDLKRWEDAVKICEKGLAATQDEALRKMLVEVRCRRFQDKMMGAWHGTVSESLGGYDQEMEFLDHGKVRVEALGRSILGTYWLDCEQTPHHLNIQVPMPDAPPEMPTPPPVPYIVKIDDKGIHLCCPYMVMERPTSFTGPGYCLMVRGSAGGNSQAEEIARLSDDEKLLRCTKELIEALPDSKLDEPKETDAEDVIREKLMLQVRFESRMYAVQKNFGEDTMQRVLAAAKGDGVLPPGLAGSAELKKLKDKLNVCGLVEDGPGGAEAPKPPTPPPKPAKEPAPRRAPDPVPTAPAAKADEAPSQSPAEDTSLALVATAGVIVAAIAVVAGVLIHRRNRVA